MCSMSACKRNKPCKEIFERITNKGKSEKLLLLAVFIKLLKKNVIVKLGIPWDTQHF